VAKPFHIYDDEFYSILGNNPTLTLIAEEASNPLFHEAVVWSVDNSSLPGVNMTTCCFSSN
jgi:hypothetical protein